MFGDQYQTWTFPIHNRLGHQIGGLERVIYQTTIAASFFGSVNTENKWKFINLKLLSCSRHRKTKFTNSESPISTSIFFNNIRLMYTLCFLVASVKLKVYKKVVKFSFKQQKILGIRNLLIWFFR